MERQMTPVYRRFYDKYKAVFLIQMLVEYFPYDVTMFWEFFRWERYNLGHIYLQCFPNGKLYAGQTINITSRMNMYSSGRGSNPHHSSAIKYHGWTNVNVLMIQCPRYMLDTIEIFLVEYYDLTDPDKGYNKTSGGRKNWTHSKETRAKISAKSLEMWERVPKLRVEQSIRMSGKTGELSPVFGKTWSWTPEQVAKISGENSHMFGKTWSKTPEQVAKSSGENSHMFGKSDADHHNFGKTWSWAPEQVANISGALNPNSKPVCVFGKVYPAAQTASDALRAKHASRSNYDFIRKWTRTKKHMPYTFYITKEFYVHTVLFEMTDITRDFYVSWSKM
jgi:hypothetical protein